MTAARPHPASQPEGPSPGGGLRFLIIDGYPRESREQFGDVGMRLAGELYRDLLLQHLPGAGCDFWYVSDELDSAPSARDLEGYAGILWPGCNRTVYHETPDVQAMLRVARDAYERGVPGFGSCWGIQVAAVAAGGKVAAHPGGREMGIARHIALTEEGRRHPMMEGKPPVYSHLVSHDDQVTAVPPGAQVLAGNDWSPVQAAAVTHRNGTFWAVQYHPEYDLHEMARLIVAREEKLLRQGFFRNREDLLGYVERLEELYRDPSRKDLRWQLGVGDDLLDDDLRQREFTNWLRHMVVGRR